MKKILIINRLGIGDVVLTTPLAQAIKEHFDTQIGFVVSPKAIDIIVNHPYIDHVFGYRQPSLDEMLKNIRSVGYEEAIIVDERFTSTLLARRAGCIPLNRGWEITIGVTRLFKRKQRALHATEDYLSYFRMLDGSTLLPTYRPMVGRVDEMGTRKVANWVEKVRLESSRVVLIFPIGLTPNKNWPLTYFSQLTAWLNQKSIVPIYLGSTNNEETIAAIEGEKYNAAGMFTLREVAELAKYADFCISVCTGPMHVAATAGIPIIALYGPTRPERWAPPSATVISADLPCVPCERIECCEHPKMACMENLTPDMVQHVIEGKGLLG
jgi:heptosyltransferase-2